MVGGIGRRRGGGVHPVLAAVGAVIVLANVIVVLGAVGIPLIGVFGLLPVLVLDVVAVAVVVLRTRRL